MEKCACVCVCVLVALRNAQEVATKWKVFRMSSTLVWFGGGGRHAVSMLGKNLCFPFHYWPHCSPVKIVPSSHHITCKQKTHHNTSVGCFSLSLPPSTGRSNAFWRLRFFRPRAPGRLLAGWRKKCQLFCVPVGGVVVVPVICLTTRKNKHFCLHPSPGANCCLPTAYIALAPFSGVLLSVTQWGEWWPACR